MSLLNVPLNSPVEIVSQTRLEGSGAPVNKSFHQVPGGVLGFIENTTASGQKLALKVAGRVKGFNEEFGIMATAFHPFDRFKTYFHHGKILENQVKGKEDSFIYQDSRLARKGYLANTPVGIYSLAVLPKMLMSLGHRVSKIFQNVSIENWFSSAKNTVSTLINNPIMQTVSRVLSPLMLVNAFYQTKRKCSSIAEINSFLAKYEKLSLGKGDYQSLKFLHNLHAEYFSLSSKELASITKEAEEFVKNKSEGIFENHDNLIVLDDEINTITTSISDSMLNEKMEEIKEDHLTLKLQELTKIIGKGPVEELSGGVLVQLLNEAKSSVKNKDPEKVLKVETVVRGIVLQAKRKKTADRIDLVVQAFFALAATSVIIGSVASGAFLGLTLTGWTTWVGSLIYNRIYLSKQNWNKVLDSSVKKTQVQANINIFGSYFDPATPIPIGLI